MLAEQPHTVQDRDSAVLHGLSFDLAIEVLRAEVSRGGGLRRAERYEPRGAEGAYARGGGGGGGPRRRIEGR